MAFDRIWVILEDHLKLYGDETGRGGPHRLSETERDTCIRSGTPFRVIREEDGEVYVTGMTWPHCESATLVEEWAPDFDDIVADDEDGEYEDVDPEDVPALMESIEQAGEFIVCPHYGHNTVQVLIGDTWVRAL